MPPCSCRPSSARRRWQSPAAAFATEVAVARRVVVLGDRRARRSRRAPSPARPPGTVRRAGASAPGTSRSAGRTARGPWRTGAWSRRSTGRWPTVAATAPGGLLQHAVDRDLSPGVAGFDQHPVAVDGDRVEGDGRQAASSGRARRAAARRPSQPGITNTPSPSSPRRDHDDLVGGRTVEHVGLAAVEPPAVARPLGGAGHRVGRPPPALGERQRARDPTGGHLGEVAGRRRLLAASAPAAWRWRGTASAPRPGPSPRRGCRPPGSRVRVRRRPRPRRAPASRARRGSTTARCGRRRPCPRRPPAPTRVGRRTPTRTAPRRAAPAGRR